MGDRDDLGRYRPGVGGNPAGRPKGWGGVAKDIARKTDDYRELVDLALSIARDTAAEDRDRLQALTLLFNRGLGQAPTLAVLEATHEHVHTGLVEHKHAPTMTTDQARRYLARLAEAEAELREMPALPPPDEEDR